MTFVTCYFFAKHSEASNLDNSSLILSQHLYVCTTFIVIAYLTLVQMCACTFSVRNENNLFSATVGLVVSYLGNV